MGRDSSLHALFSRTNSKMTMEVMDFFIEKVKIRPVLYDSKHQDYKNYSKKCMAWNEIGQEIGVHGKSAKIKWKNLRDTYSKYLRSIKTTTGQAAKKRYGHWKWANQMEFLKTFISYAKTVSNITESPGDVTTSRTEVFSQNKDSLQDESSASANIQPEREKQSGSSAKQVEPPLQDKLEDTPLKDIRYLQNKAPKRAHTDMDELECLFMGHAKSVKKLSVRRQAIVKMKVAHIIAEQELLHLDEVASTNFPLSFPNNYANLPDDQYPTITSPTHPMYLLPNYNTSNEANTKSPNTSTTTAAHFQKSTFLPLITLIRYRQF